VLGLKVLPLAKNVKLPNKKVSKKIGLKMIVAYYSA
jgi:hypothetical protein